MSSPVTAKGVQSPAQRKAEEEEAAARQLWWDHDRGHGEVSVPPPPCSPPKKNSVLKKAPRDISLPLYTRAIPFQGHLRNAVVHAVFQV